MMDVHLDRPWLTAELAAPMRVLSWAVSRPGFVTARRIVWREVRNADLPADLDVATCFEGELAATGRSDAVAMLTSRDVSAHVLRRVRVEGVSAACLATVGLSNAERVGARVDRSGHDWGTINIAVALDCELHETALIEAMSIAAEARTVAVMEAGLDLPVGRATGTGTDCIAVAAPPGALAYAGLHTPQGEALGRAVREAVAAGAEEWMSTVRRTVDAQG